MQLEIMVMQMQVEMMTYEEILSHLIRGELMVAMEMEKMSLLAQQVSLMTYLTLFQQEFRRLWIHLLLLVGITPDPHLLL
jgi:hypothetical protein